MKKNILFFVVIFLSFTLFSQDKSLGFFLGTSYYNGDANKFIPFNQPSFAIGAMYVHDLDKKLSLRIFANKASLKGSSDAIPSFKTNIYDIGFMFEINMINNLRSNYRKPKIIPFFELGASVLLVPQLNRSVNLSLPVGAGIKYATTEKLTIALEWNYHITNTDELDLVVLKELNKSFNPLDMLQNDWYSYFGVILRYNIFYQDHLCPAYQ